MSKVEKTEWPRRINFNPDPERIKKDLEIYARVVSREVPAQLREEFQLTPEELRRKIF